MRTHHLPKLSSIWKENIFFIVEVCAVTRIMLTCNQDNHASNFGLVNELTVKSYASHRLWKERDWQNATFPNIIRSNIRDNSGYSGRSPPLTNSVMRKGYQIKITRGVQLYTVWHFELVSCTTLGTCGLRLFVPDSPLRRRLGFQLRWSWWRFPLRLPASLPKSRLLFLEREEYKIYMYGEKKSTMDWNYMKSTYLIHKHMPLSHELVSERMNDRSRAPERSEQCGASESVSSASERTSE